MKNNGSKGLLETLLFLAITISACNQGNSPESSTASLTTNQSSITTVTSSYTPRPTITPRPSLTPSRYQILASVCEGTGVPEAAQLSNGPLPHRITLIGVSNWEVSIPESIRSQDVAQTEIVACVLPEDVFSIQECKYIPYGSVVRYRYFRPFELRVAQTGEIIDTYELWGSIPSQECPSKITTSITGSKKGIYGWNVVVQSTFPILDFYSTLENIPRTINWELEKQQIAAGKPSRVYFLEFTSDGRALITGNCDIEQGEEVVRIWDAALMIVQDTYTIAGCSNGFALSPDGLLLAMAGGDKIRILNLDDGQIINEFESQDRQIEFFPDGKKLIGTTGTVWDLDTNQNLSIFTHEDAVIVMVPGENKLMVSSYAEHSTWLLDIPSGTEIRKFDYRSFESLLVPPNAKTFVGGGYDFLGIYNFISGENIFNISSDDLYGVEHLSNYPLAISPDGKVVATYAQGAKGTDFENHVLRFWNMGSGELIRTLPIHTNVLAFSPNGKALVWGGDDGLIYLWDTDELIPEP